MWYLLFNQGRCRDIWFDETRWNKKVDDILVRKFPRISIPGRLAPMVGVSAVDMLFSDHPKCLDLVLIYASGLMISIRSPWSGFSPLYDQSPIDIYSTPLYSDSKMFIRTSGHWSKYSIGIKEIPMSRSQPGVYVIGDDDYRMDNRVVDGGEYMSYCFCVGTILLVLYMWGWEG